MKNFYFSFFLFFLFILLLSCEGCGDWQCNCVSTFYFAFGLSSFYFSFELSSLLFIVKLWRLHAVINPILPFQEDSTPLTHLPILRLAKHLVVVVTQVLLALE